eukprot:78044_1
MSAENAKKQTMDPQIRDIVTGFLRSDIHCTVIKENIIYTCCKYYCINPLLMSCLQIGDTIQLDAVSLFSFSSDESETATIKFMNSTNFSEPFLVLGLELEKSHINGTNGTISGSKYFDVTPGRGFFMRNDDYCRLNGRMFACDRGEKVDTLLEYPNIGDIVRTITRRAGKVTFVGRTNFVDGIAIGLQLAYWWANGHDGSVHGCQYFACFHGFGCFVRLHHLVENLGGAGAPINNYDRSIEKYERLHQFQIGDNVKLPDSKTGIVQYIGQPHFALHELIGIKLDEWSANAGNGIVHDEKIFDVSPGRGYFTLRKYVANMNQLKVIEGGYSLLKDLARFPKLNGKMVKNITYFKKKGRWKVRLMYIQQKKYLGAKEENLEPVFDHRKALKFEPTLGDRVKTREDLHGIVCYVGNVEFDALDTKYVGLELEEWNVNGHNGTIQGKQYFKVTDGMGYLVKLQSLVENLGHIFNGKKFSTIKEMNPMIKDIVIGFIRFEQNKLSLNSIPSNIIYLCILYYNINVLSISQFKVGDIIQLDALCIYSFGTDCIIQGKIKWVHPGAFHEGEPVLGVELEQSDINTTNGWFNNKQYFATYPGKGLFVTEKLKKRRIIDAHVGGLLNEYPKNGDVVKTVNGEEGIVQYIGKTDFSDEIVIGLVMTMGSWSPNKNHGSVTSTEFASKQYFNCFDGLGCFVKISHLISIYSSN